MTAPAEERAGNELAPRGSGAMFDGIAKRYDLLNRVMSFGLDRRWRRKTVRLLGLEPGAEVLDVATGTADVALEILRAHPGVRVVGVDPSREMLAIAQHKSAAKGLDSRLRFEQGAAEALPFDARTFDAVTMAFGIRNCANRPAALREIARVLKPEGRVAILELAEPTNLFARFHVHHMVPRMGALLSGSREYRYLQTSIAAFPEPAAFTAMMEDAGLRVLSTSRLTMGTCHIFVAARVEVER